MRWHLNYNTDKWLFYRTSTVPWSLNDFPNIFCNNRSSTTETHVTVNVLPSIENQVLYRNHFYTFWQGITKALLTGIEKISSLITSAESHCYMHTEQHENDLKFVMNVWAICPLSLHDNETKSKEGKRMLKLVHYCCKNYFNLSGKCIFETLMMGWHSIICCPVYTQNNKWLQPSPLCNSVTLMQKW